MYRLFDLVQAVELDNGFVVEKTLSGDFPALQDVLTVDHACDVCPFRKPCDDNNEFDCQVYQMFSGLYGDIGEIEKCLARLVEKAIL